MDFFQDIAGGSLIGEVGGKARGLLYLSQAEFPIPPSFVLSAETLAELYDESGAIREDKKDAFLTEAKQLFDDRWPVIARSSAFDEDGRARSWPGIFESVMVKKEEDFPGAVGRVLNSFRGPNAKKYRSLHKLAEPVVSGMAVVIQPFLLGEIAGVCTLFHQYRMIVEVARGHNLAITSGKRAPMRAIFNLEAGVSTPKGDSLPPRKALNEIVSTVMRIQEALFRNQNVAVEFTFRGEKLTLLQARPNPSGAPEEDPLDLPGIYARVAEFMDAMEIQRTEWSLLETFDLLAFHYLGRRRHRGEPIEHFRIRIHGDAASRVKSAGWIASRMGGYDNLYSPPPENKAARERIEELARDGILMIFSLDENDDFIRFERTFRSKGKEIRLGFSYPMSETTIEEWAFEKRRLDRSSAAQARDHIDRQRRDLDLMEKMLIVREDVYEQGMIEQIGFMRKHVLEHGAVIDEVLKEGIPEGGTAGISFKPNQRVVRGVAVTEKTVMKTRAKRFIYFADDLEPSFLDQIGRMDAVVVSRGAFCSHAAALCSEFNIPLVVETRNIHLINEGDEVEVDLWSGVVETVGA